LGFHYGIADALFQKRTTFDDYSIVCARTTTTTTTTTTTSVMLTAHKRARAPHIHIRHARHSKHVHLLARTSSPTVMLTAANSRAHARARQGISTHLRTRSCGFTRSK